VIDEMLTPDSSRYWPADEYRTGVSPPSFDKQYVRDYYLGTDWDHTPPAPDLPSEVIRGTRARYVEAYELLTGRSFDEWHRPEDPRGAEDRRYD
jgi:phosphoribosylaminoimidazole-succinocarboxamide synthase